MKTLTLLILVALLTTASVDAASLGPATFSAGAARLDNGSLVNLGQPLIVLAGASTGAVTPGLLPIIRATQSSHPPFTIMPAGRWSPNGFSLSFIGQAGTDYVLWASTNLNLWTPILTNRASRSEVLLQDSSAAQQPWRFYRVGTEAR